MRAPSKFQASNDPRSADHPGIIPVWRPIRDYEDDDDGRGGGGSGSGAGPNPTYDTTDSSGTQGALRIDFCCWCLGELAWVCIIRGHALQARVEINRVCEGRERLALCETEVDLRADSGRADYECMSARCAWTAAAARCGLYSSPMMSARFFFCSCARAWWPFFVFDALSAWGCFEDVYFCERGIGVL